MCMYSIRFEGNVVKDINLLINYYTSLILNTKL